MDFGPPRLANRRKLPVSVRSIACVRCDPIEWLWLVVSTNSGGRRTSRFPPISSPRLTKNRVVKTGDVSWFETFRTCDAAAVTRLSPSTWPLVRPVSGADHVKVDKASKAALKTEAMKAPNCGKGRQKRLQSTHTGHYTHAAFFFGGSGWLVAGGATQPRVYDVPWK